MATAWWVLACAVATLTAAEVAAYHVDEDDRDGWDVLLLVCLIATAVLAVAAVDVATAHG